MSLFNKPSNTYKTGDATVYYMVHLRVIFNYMKIIEGFRVPEAQIYNSQEVYSVK